MSHKEEVFNTLATLIDSYAWVTANTLKEKFGVIDSEEEYEKIKEEVVDYVESQEFKDKVHNAEVDILQRIGEAVINELEVLSNGND